jgi:hypothetical protein
MPDDVRERFLYDAKYGSRSFGLKSPGRRLSNSASFEFPCVFEILQSAILWPE